MRPLLIIGSHGMLGQDLMKAFPAARGVDRDELDITDAAATEGYIARLQPSAVINAAAYNAVDLCESDAAAFETAKLINGTAVGNLARACTEQGVPLVHYSTNYVFDGTSQAGYRENDEPHPVNRYGQSKLLGETEVQAYVEQGLQLYIIRTSKLFGAPAQSGAAKKSFFQTMIDLARERDELRVVNDELSNFTYTPDLAAFTKTLLDNSYPPGIYHGVNDGPCTWFEGAKTLFDRLGSGVKLVPVAADAFPRPAKRPHFGALLNTKGPQMRHWEEALREFLG